MPRAPSAYRTNCPGCGVEWVVLERNLGGTAHCKECNTRFVIPENLRPAKDVEVETGDGYTSIKTGSGRGSRPSGKRKKKKSSRDDGGARFVMPTAATLVLIVVLAVGKGVVRYLKDKQRNQRPVAVAPQPWEEAQQRTVDQLRAEEEARLFSEKMKQQPIVPVPQAPVADNAGVVPNAKRTAVSPERQIPARERFDEFNRDAKKQRAEMERQARKQQEEMRLQGEQLKQRQPIQPPFQNR